MFARQLSPLRLAPPEVQDATGSGMRNLNRILKKYKLEAAEPSFQTSMEEADRAQSAAQTQGIDAPNMSNFVTFHFPADAGDAPAPPGDFDSAGLASMEMDDAPPPLDVDEVEAEVEIMPKKKTRTTRSGRRKT